MKEKPLSHIYRGQMLINGHNMLWEIITVTKCGLLGVKKQISLARIYKDHILTAEFVDGKRNVRPDHQDEETHICYACAVSKTDCNTHASKTLFDDIFVWHRKKRDLECQIDNVDE